MRTGHLQALNAINLLLRKSVAEEISKNMKTGMGRRVQSVVKYAKTRMVLGTMCSATITKLSLRYYILYYLIYFILRSFGLNSPVTELSFNVAFP